MRFWEISNSEPSLEAFKVPEPSHEHSDSESSARSLDFKLSEDNWVKHEEVVASYADLRAVLKEVDERKTLLKSLDRVSKTLEADSALKATMKAIADTNTINSNNITGLTKLLRNANLPEIMTKLNAFQTSLNSLSSQCASILESLKEDPEFNQRLLKVAEGYIQNSARLI
ncbi:hypothetical protein Tco_0071549 [Tanacetum coccineum]